MPHKTPKSPPRPLEVLVAEDNPIMQTVIKFMLNSWGYRPILVPDGAQAWEALRGEASPRLALLDWMMPGVDGVELCRRLRARRGEPYTYILLLSARSDAGDLVKAMEAGADDYLVKPFDAQELRVRLNAGSRIVRLQEQLVAAREALREQASCDSLTGLLNHGYILRAARQACRESGREGRPVSVLLADIDRFRQINETFGHAAGDDVLREFARRLRAVLPEGASAGRYGGAEFLIVLAACGADAAREIAVRLRDSVAGSAFTAGAAAFPVTCSVGVACRESPDECDPAPVLRDADEALSHAKRQGRNQVASACAAPQAEPVA